MTRQETLDTIRREPDVSVLIVGGGINGAGLFRELALQGIDTLLVEKSDFCAGTSAASGRVLHGGLRYLENGEFRLVRESLHERNRMLSNAPHYVQPLPTTIPIYSWTAGIFNAARKFFGISDRPGDRGAFIITMGLTLYDLFSGWRHPMPRHSFQRRGKALKRRPLLNPDIVCTATYYDAKLMYAERLCLEVILDGEAMTPKAHALNYVRVSGAAGDTVTLLDELSGQTVKVRPKIVVNASGAWIDFTNRAMQRDTRFIGGTKGSHLVVDHPELWQATQGHMFYFANTDGRLTIFYPLEDKVLIGTTDIPVEDPDMALCDEDEVDYLLQSVNYVLPTIKLDRSHIVFRFSGVRPLPRSAAAIPGQISRDHSCPVVAPGNCINFPIYSLVGGKWTTFRAFAEQVTDLLLPVLKRQRMADSTNLQIGGGKSYPRTDAERRQWIASAQKKTGLDPKRIETLLEHYGTRAEAMAEYIAAGDDHLLRNHPQYSEREPQYLADHEKIVHLDDLILRRTMMGMLGQVTLDLLDDLAAAIAPVLGWSPQERQAEVERTLRILETRHGVTLKRLPEAVVED